MKLCHQVVHCALATVVSGCTHTPPVVSPVTASQAIAVPAADSVLAHETFTIKSAALGEDRKINVYTPPQYAGSNRKFPVLYMPDGGIDEDFPHVIRTVDSLVALGAIRPVMVVGVPNTQRRRDLTGPTRVKSDSAIAPHVGGSAAFRRFFSEELIPEINRRYRTTDERGIMGESLAGLFVVETFLEAPDLFSHFIAFDPSVWWNNGALVDSAPPRIRAMDGKSRTLYLATSFEPSTVEGTGRLVAMFGAAPPSKLRWTYAPHSELSHATIFRGAKPAALVDAFH